ncbi:methyl-accepting chemotaxis protein, partial [Georgenia sp. 311]
MTATTSGAAGPERATRSPRRTSVQTKILALVLLLVTVAGAGGLYSSVSGSRTSERATGMVTLQSEIGGAQDDLTAAHREGRLLVAQIAAAVGPDAKAGWATVLEELSASTATLVDRIGASEVGSWPEWESFLTGWAEWTDFRDRMLVPAALETSRSRYSALASTDGTSYVERVEADLAALSDRVDSLVAQEASAIKANSARGRVVLLVAILVGISLAGTAGFLLARSIRRSVDSVRHSLSALAHGDFTVPAAVRTRDEIGEMAEELNEARRCLSELVGSVAATSTSVAVATAEVATATEQVGAQSRESSTHAESMAVAAEQVSQNIHTVATGAEQMGSSIQEISQNANEAAAVAA